MTQSEREAVDEDNVICLDKILQNEVGPCGKYQLRVIALCSLLTFATGFAKTDFIYTLSKVKTRCLIPECEGSSTSTFTPPWILNAVPASASSFDNCHRYGLSTMNNTSSCSSDMFDRSSVIECNEYVYEDTEKSARFEFNLACDDWRPYIIGSVDLLGMLICLPLTGIAADLWGRRTLMVICGFNAAWVGCLKYFSNSYMSYLLIGFLESLTGASSYSFAYILVIEYVGPKYRVGAGTTLHMFTALGRSLSALAAWNGFHWRNLILVLKMPLLISIFYFWLAPESVRWLISKRRFEESLEILKRAAKVNGDTLSKRTLESFSVNAKNEGNKVEKSVSEPSLASQVLKHKRILLRCVLTAIWWISSLFVFHGLAMSAVGITGNFHLNLFLVNLVDIPGFLFGVLLMNKFGRKPLIFVAFWICGGCQIAYILIPSGSYALSLSTYLIGKLCIGAVVTSLYVYTAELYPTRYRTSFLTCTSMVGRIGAILGPLTPSLSAVIWQHLPFALFAGMAFLSGLLVLLAPETLGTMLPDTMEEANNLGRDKPNQFVYPLQKLVFKRKCYNLT